MCEALDVDAAVHDAVIDTLCDILEKRDEAKKAFEESGGFAQVEHTNARGATNLARNPLLTTWDDLNKTALAYWRELGLTPASYTRMTGGEPKKKKGSGLVAALKLIETG